MVLATQNPIESYGTFPLPEAQMDRFLMRISMGYPSKEEERRILLNTLEDVFDTIHAVFENQELLSYIEEIKKVSAKKEVMDYLLDLVEKTRNHEKISVGVSPRGSIALFRASQAKAAVEGRSFMLPEDVQYMAPFVLNHRISSGMGQSLDESMEIISEIMKETKVPLEDLEAL